MREIRKGLTFVNFAELDRGDSLVDIGAYCLMPNHFHLLIHEKEENGISFFMKKLSTAFSMYFNMIHGRTGKLFEGVFRAEHADKDEYFEYLFAYLHLNPVKLIDPKWKEEGISNLKKAQTYLSDYHYSSYLDYLEKDWRPESLILNKSAFPDYFEDVKEFDDFIKFWLNIQR